MIVAVYSISRIRSDSEDKRCFRNDSSSLSALRASGGGDGPELAMSGILLALANVRVGSTCYFFTDASAKDITLYPIVWAWMALKKVEVRQ